MKTKTFLFIIIFITAITFSIKVFSQIDSIKFIPSVPIYGDTLKLVVFGKVADGAPYDTTFVNFVSDSIIINEQFLCWWLLNTNHSYVDYINIGILSPNINILKISSRYNYFDETGGGYQNSYIDTKYINLKQNVTDKLKNNFNIINVNNQLVINYIDCENKTNLELININGICLYSKVLNGQSGKLVISTNELKRGLYILRFIDSEKAYSKKIIIN